MRSRAAIAGALTIVLAACTGDARESLRTQVAVGQPAPAYATRTLQGDSASVAGLRGSVVLLNIWATWCFPCRAEMPFLQALHERHATDGLHVVGVSIDAGGEDRAVVAFAEQYGITFPLWRDPEGRVSTLYRAIGVPATYLIDRDGVLVYRKVGPVDEHDRAFMQALERALASQPDAAD